MKPLSAEECLAHILKDIERRRFVDYSDKNSVRRYNTAFDRIIEKANYICENYPEKMELFIALLDHPDYFVAATCTSILYGLRNATKEHKHAAIASAKRLCIHPAASEHERIIWSVNIERWEANL